MSKKEFEKELVKLFPNLYKDMWGDKSKTCMAWGIDTGPGWYDLITKLSKNIESLISVLPEEQKELCKASQVKTKFGTLCFYMDNATAEMQDLISEAQKESQYTCEQCGKPGTLLKDSSWWRTNCNDCEILYKQKRGVL